MPDTTDHPTVNHEAVRTAARTVGDQLEDERLARVRLREAQPQFTPEQVTQLLRPINTRRVVDDGQGHASLSQQDVTAHLIRVFGFGSFDVDVLETECLFETPRDENGRRWDICYRAKVRLTVRDPRGREVCHYEDGSTGMAQNQARGDGHDLAYKAAISLAKKRAAVPLGDQFGLSLYNRGQIEGLVGATLVHPSPRADTPEDVQQGVQQQVSLGNAETDPDPAPPADTPPPAGPLSTAQIVDELVTLADQLNIDIAQLTAKWRASHGGIDVAALDSLDPTQLGPLLHDIRKYVSTHPGTGSGQ